MSEMNINPSKVLNVLQRKAAGDKELALQLENAILQVMLDDAAPNGETEADLAEMVEVTD